MKRIIQIKSDKRFQTKETRVDGISGWVTIKGQIFFCIAANGGGWDHVSVSHKKRCPTWEEMCVIKEIFFFPEECCCEYHPAESDYVNVHPFCLHIWKPQDVELPTPPKLFV